MPNVSAQSVWVRNWFYFTSEGGWNTNMLPCRARKASLMTNLTLLGVSEHQNITQQKIHNQWLQIVIQAFIWTVRHSGLKKNMLLHNNSVIKNSDTDQALLCMNLEVQENTHIFSHAHTHTHTHTHKGSREQASYLQPHTHTHTCAHSHTCTSSCSHTLTQAAQNRLLIQTHTHTSVGKMQANQSLLISKENSCTHTYIPLFVCFISFLLSVCPHLQRYDRGHWVI